MRKQLCPTCGSTIYRWWESNSFDPGDVEPHGRCTNPDCDWEF